MGKRMEATKFYWELHGKYYRGFQQVGSLESVLGMPPHWGTNGESEGFCGHRIFAKRAVT